VSGLASDRILVIGSGHVALATAVRLSLGGNPVLCLIEDSDNLERISEGILPVHEPGLRELLSVCIERGDIQFSYFNDLGPKESFNTLFFAAACSGIDGKKDLEHTLSWAQRVTQLNLSDPLVIVRSTLPPGSSHIIGTSIKDGLENKSAGNAHVHSVYFPEFISEGSALTDSGRPYPFIVGVDSNEILEDLLRLFRETYGQDVSPTLVSVTAAELSKYCINAFLGIRIGFINEVSRLCDKMGGDINEVRKALAVDKRIGSHYLTPGPGYGGTTFPKDLETLINTGEQVEAPQTILASAFNSNEFQKKYLISRYEEKYGNIDSGRTIAVCGLSFKNSSPDITNSPALSLIPELLKRKAKVRAFDELSMNSFKKIFPNLEYSDSPYTCVENADSLFMLNTHSNNDFIDWKKVLQMMRGNVILDGRNSLDKEKLQEIGFDYLGVGR
jgi:UDPglucose 6-dehydrogenase